MQMDWEHWNLYYKLAQHSFKSQYFSLRVGLKSFQRIEEANVYCSNLKDAETACQTNK
ncbi:hypothetical protein ACU8KH_02330 [Lachancea thermotolerans]